MVRLHEGLILLVLTLCLTSKCVHSHHGDESEHAEDGHHDTVKHHTQHHRKPAHSVKPKFVSISTWPVRSSKPKPTVLYVFNTERYEAWTDWSDCLPRDCIEVRYRKCMDDSWKQAIDDKTRAPGCLSKFYAEKRTCLNTTECHRNKGEKLLRQWRETCGIQPEASKYVAKILGGNAVTPHTWPWTVRLAVKARGNKSISFCGGTLVAPDLVLTAAHCLVSLNERIPAGRPFQLSDYTPHELYAHTGDHNREVREKSQQDVRVDQAIIHPQYHRKLMTDGYDVALLYLSQPFNITKETSLVCLPPNDLKLEPGTKCVAVGWGNDKKPRKVTHDSLQSILESFLQPRPFFDPFGASSWHWGKRRSRRRSTERLGTLELHEVELPIIDNKKCLKHFVELNTEFHICAGSKGKDTCGGDSGGGLYCQLPDSNQWALAGITSYGLSLGCGHNPGVYTSTAAHLQWIINNLVSPVSARALPDLHATL